jgi:hypothetical protein
MVMAARRLRARVDADVDQQAHGARIEAGLARLEKDAGVDLHGGRPRPFEYPHLPLLRERKGLMMPTPRRQVAAGERGRVFPR